MNDKQNDKSIGLPSRGRPRKKDYSSDSVFNNDFMHKGMFSSSLGHDLSTEEMSLGSMRPYNVRDENKMLEQFNKIGDVISRPVGQQGDILGQNEVNIGDYMRTQQGDSMRQNEMLRNFGDHNRTQKENFIRQNDTKGNLGDQMRQNEMMRQDEVVRNNNVSDRKDDIRNINDVRNASEFRQRNMDPRQIDYSSLNDLRQDTIKVPYRAPFKIENALQISPKEIQNGKQSFNDYQHFSNNQSFGNTRPNITPFYEESSFTNFFSKQDPSDFPTSLYNPYFTNSRPVLNTGNFYRGLYVRPQKYNRALLKEEPLDSWAYKKKRKNNPILWQYVKNPGDNYQSIVHPSKYSSLDYIQGSNIFGRRGISERDCNNSILPLFLNSNKEINDEYRRIVKNFQKRVKELDFTNVTVHQLKLLMREFGLNHTGKKNELIERAKQTLKKIEIACSGAHKRTVESNKEEKNEDEYENIFF